MTKAKNPTATDCAQRRLNDIRERLDTLTAEAHANFGIDEDDASWAEVGTLCHYLETLDGLLDKILKRGEYAK